MDKLKFYFPILIFALGLSSPLFAQSEDGKGPKKVRAKTVSGEATVELGRSMTIEEAQYIAVFEARKDALANAFGTKIESRSIIRIDNRSDAFEQIGVNTVDGKWLRDLQEPACETYSNDRGTYVKCAVRGKAQEIKKVPIPLEVLPLDGKERKDRTAQFKNDDDFFIYFKAPVNGYVSVYLMLKEKVQCLLPYAGLEDGYMKVNADQEYILFSEKGAPEYFMWTEDAMETNLLVTIFSPEEYTKPFLKKIKENVPKELEIDEFMTWLGQQSSNYEQLQVVNQIITISKD